MPPKARRKPRPDRSSERLEIYLTTKCFCCLDTPNIHSSRPLPCCGQNIHEDCLLGCLRFANQAVQDTCPHCRATLTPYHISDVNIPLGPNLFCFHWLTCPPPPPPPLDPNKWFEYYGVPLEDDDPFPRYVLPQPPPGWHDFMRHQY